MLASQLMRALLVALTLTVLPACAAIAQAPRGAPSASDARAVCSAVAEGRAQFLEVVGNQGGRDYEGWTSLDVDNDGAVDEIAIVSDGSSGTPGIQVRGRPQGGYLDSQYSSGDEAYGPWAGQIELVRHHGRIYEVFYSDRQTHDFPVYVAIHLPHDVGQWVCGFESAAPLPPLTPLRADAAPICEAIEQRLAYTAEDFPFTPTEDVGRAPGELVLGAGRVDFMNDGAPRSLRQMEYASGAGAGFDAYFYDLSNPQGSEAALLAALQAPDATRGLPGCHGNVARFHRVNGVVVFEQRFPGERPQRLDQHFWWVSRIEGGQMVRLCEARPFVVTPRAIKYNPALYPQAG